ncbi:TPA: DNA repair protein, partial [Streptococcus suis]|nr:DNA repair protein [Streptococcus suis]
RIMISQSGSIAEASMKLTNIFEEAQKAAEVYLYNVKNKIGDVHE